MHARGIQVRLKLLRVDLVEQVRLQIICEDCGALLCQHDDCKINKCRHTENANHAANALTVSIPLLRRNEALKALCNNHTFPNSFAIDHYHGPLVRWQLAARQVA
jgi:hypothetical protein